jgi:class 3 adenylate cyclase
MSVKRHDATLVRVMRAPRDVVWALVADTNRWNRAAGLAPGAYAWKVVDGRREYVGAATELGQKLVWYEPPYEWSEGHLVAGQRHFLEGPASGGGLTVSLTSTPEGATRVEATAWVSGSGPLMALLGRIVQRRNRAALVRYLDAIEATLAREAALDGPAAEPAVIRVRRALMSGYDAIVSGERSATDLAELSLRADKLARAGTVEPALVTRLRTLLAERPDEEIAQLRPFEVARAWGIDKRAALRLFLHATRAGLVDLRWQINCPVCRVSAGVVDGLDGVGRAVHCEACDIERGIDFGRHVEAVFQANPAVRRTETRVYCASTPAFRPHVLAQVRVSAGETRRVAANLVPGELFARVVGRSGGVDLSLTEAPATLALEVGEDTLDARPEGTRVPAQDAQLVIRNAGREPVTVLVERAGWSADAVLGSVVASFPDFLDLFATEAPATGVDLAIGELTVLFSDLTGSTALYERVGDARAFAVVEEHFRAMARAITAHEGAIVKTMGDAVMATFASPALAVRAAADMVAANDAQHGALGLGVKLGVHPGACLAVRANDRLDFFGGTVNLAARLQAQARAGEVVVTAETAAHPAVAALFAGRQQRHFEAALKGIAAPQRLVAVSLAASGARPVLASLPPPA